MIHDFVMQHDLMVHSKVTFSKRSREAASEVAIFGNWYG